MARLGGAVLCALACLTAALVVTAPAAFAAETQTHVFDATLSLTANCQTSGTDPVADPSCPAGPPDGALEFPLGVATDTYGDIYYFGLPKGGEPNRIYVFDSSGHFLTEVPAYAAIENVGAVTIDAGGNLYVATTNGLYVLKPSAYDPEAGEVAYADPPTVVPIGPLHVTSVSVEQTTGRVFALGRAAQVEIAELGSYAEGNPVLRTFDASVIEGFPENIAVDAKDGLIYASGDATASASSSVISVFDREGNLLKTMTGVKTAQGFHEFIAPFGQVGVAVDESTGHLFVSDVVNNPNPSVYELSAAGEPVSTIAHSFAGTDGSNGIVIDNGIHSPSSSMNPESPLAEEENPNGSYLFQPSGEGTGHLFAFRPKLIPKPPLIAGEGVAGVSETEAVLEAKVNPEGLPTKYHFEYVDAATFERDVEESGVGHGFDHATSAGAGTLATGNDAVSVSLPLSSLQPGTSYRFRLLAANACEGVAAPECTSEGEAVGFATYPALAPAPGPCHNGALRIGPSVALPDCRAYELVTPANTNGHAPQAPASTVGPPFATPPVSAQGEAVGFLVVGGAIPGYPGAGAGNGDPYVATRAAGGWQTASVGPSGALSTNPGPGGFSPDLRYVAWWSGPEDAGSLALTEYTSYIHYPDGSEHLVGEGSLASDPKAQALFIGAGASHIVFYTGSPRGDKTPQLEPDAPPSGTVAIYDRTPDGVTHVVSLLPGDVTPAAGEGAAYLGVSADGSAVAFGVGLASPLYLRLDDSETLQAAGPGATFEGLSANGRYAFYLSGGDLYRYNTQGEVATRITESGDVTVVNVPSQGTSAYFVSPSRLGEVGEANPNGAKAVAGEANLYRWDGAAIHFIATLTDRDMKGEQVVFGGGTRGALGSWASNLAHEGETARDPSRATPDGEAIVFESGADLAGYRSGGSAEIYRYDAAEGTLACLSCNPTQAAPVGNANLQSIFASGAPTGPHSQIPNLSASGRRVFFESPDPLVAADVDGVLDVYEWETNGEGSCATPGGCVSLVSSGQSAHDSYLYGVSESGRDVFIDTTDLLVPQDPDETPSIYDARVEGGFPPPAARAAECLGEACQPAAVALNDLTPASLVFSGSGNVIPQQPAAQTKMKAKTTNAQRLVKALKACKKERKSQRKRCEVQVRKRYGKQAKKSTRARHASSHGRTVR